jgi:hypothetical protein
MCQNVESGKKGQIEDRQAAFFCYAQEGTHATSEQNNFAAHCFKYANAQPPSCAFAHLELHLRIQN